PGMWWLRRSLRMVREDCCDDILITHQLATPMRYCETLIEAAACRLRSLPEPVALGFAEGEHPTARRIRRLMSGGPLRTRRIGLAAVLVILALAAFLLPGLRPERAPVAETDLSGLFGWKNLPFQPDPEELAIIEECREIRIRWRSTYGNDQRRRFDDDETRIQLETMLERRPQFFYVQHLLGTWHRRNGDLAQAKQLLESALKNAPVVLTQRYRAGDGTPLTELPIEEMEIECNQVHNHSLDPSLRLGFIDLTTDAQGEISVPVYDTVYRLSMRAHPRGYDTDMQRLGWFRSRARIGQLPDIIAWKQHTRPHDFTRTASESSLLQDALIATEEHVSSGPNEFVLGRVARCQADGTFIDEPRKHAHALSPLPQIRNADFIDHAIIDLTAPAANQFELSEIRILDSRTKIPLDSFQAGAGVRVFDRTRFHVYSVQDPLPDAVDLMLTVRNLSPGGFQMIIPPIAGQVHQHEGVSVTIDHLAAGQHAGWSSSQGLMGEPVAPDFVAEMMCTIKSGKGSAFTMTLVTIDGRRIELDAFVPQIRIPRPLAEIDHFELSICEQPETICFENIRLPQRHHTTLGVLPPVHFDVDGAATTLSSDAYWPMALTCRSNQGNIYGGGVASSSCGCELYARDPDQIHPEAETTITVEGLMPGNLKLSLSAQAADGAPLQIQGGQGCSWQHGALKSITIPAPLTSVGRVTVQVQ
ncbi:MAG: hypothetical protein KDA85_15440, partial [Planctomycetaceae bacterium]|nr:hypothetical protein [Planctomycetaceae bacterium]